MMKMNQCELTHLSLFSGIGGLDLAAEWAGFKTVWQCEIAEFPFRVLKKHWPDVPKWRNINELSADDFFRRTGRKSATIISGGFPCQPHSVAGKRLASIDERELWPEMRRVIGEIKPKWVLCENVRGLLSSEDGRFFRGIIRDFAQLGYAVGWGITSAAAVGAIHRRERLAIVANANTDRLERWVSEEKQHLPEKMPAKLHVHLLRYADENDLSKSGILRGFNGVPGRVDRTRAIGNAVCQQQFFPFFDSIAKIERWINEDT